jgi:hypothetical protein
MVNGCRIWKFLDYFDDLRRNPWRLILKDLLENLLPKMDFSPLICKMRQINLELEVLNGYRDGSFTI